MSGKCELVTEAKSYDVLVGAQLPTRFIQVLTSNMADTYCFAGFVNDEALWFEEDFHEWGSPRTQCPSSSTLEENEELEGIDDINEESLQIEKSTWGNVEDLQDVATKPIQEVWQWVVLPHDEEERGIDIIKDMGPPLDTSTIHWQPSKEGITLLELFGEVAIGLVVVLQASTKVRRYLYVDNSGLAKKVAIHHIEKLRKRFPTLLPRIATKRAFIALPSDVSLISREEITIHGPISLVIVGWPCQGLSMASHQNSSQDSRTTGDEQCFM